MKKNRALFLVIVSSLGLAACATSGNSPTTAKSDAPNVDRRIAQQATIEYTVARQDLPKVCGHAPDANVNLPPDNQMILVSHQEAVTRFTIRTPLYDCETVQNDGTQGEWKGFYNKGGKKAEMLDDAILGVGKETAPYLVPYFSQGKPRSWREFSDLIIGASKEIERRSGISTAWTKQVLIQYKERNMHALGYTRGAACKVVGYNDDSYEERQYIRDVPVVVEPSVSGGKLLPGECETYSVSFNGREVSGSVSSDYNRYGLSVNYDDVTSDYNRSGRKVKVAFKGKRIQANPGYLVEYKGSTISANGGTAQLVLRNAALHEMMGVQEFADKCKLSATAIFLAKKGSFWGSIFSGGKAQKTVTQELDGNSDTTTITSSGITLKENEKVAAKVTTAFGPNCPFYNTTSIEIGSFD